LIKFFITDNVVYILYKNISNVLKCIMPLCYSLGFGFVGS